jgi:NaMN:DMB phosphoribosyltransferase
MRKRITLLVAATMLALTMALGGAGAALAQTPAERACEAAGGTFTPGNRSTCVVVVVNDPVTSPQECQFNQGGKRQGEQEVTTQTTTTTTIVFSGRSANVQSSTPVTSEPEIIATGECRNVPGPQR